MAGNRLIVGLGNPGRKYQRTRHNIGFRVVDELARRHGYSFRSKFGGELATGALSVASRPYKALLFKPMEFMNLSGHAVLRAVQFYNLEAPDIVVIHDEIDIDFGRLKLKAGGGHGGHNGLRSIISQLGKRDFLRVRVGVGKPGRPGTPRGDRDRDQRVAGHVLSDFPSALEAEVTELVDRAADATEVLVSEGIRAAMNRFHGAAERGDGDAAPEEDRGDEPRKSR